MLKGSSFKVEVRDWVQTVYCKMPRLFKKSQKYNVARNCFLARIVLLDKTTIEFNLLPEVTGSDCLEKVAQVMEIQEVSLFAPYTSTLATCSLYY